MITVNLLRDGAFEGNAPTGRTRYKVTSACALVVALTVLTGGWRYWSSAGQLASIEREAVHYRQEAARIRAAAADTDQINRRRDDLLARISMLEVLREAQSLPLELLDHISRSLPEHLWLTRIEWDGVQVSIEGRGTRAAAVTQFGAALADETLLQRPVEIVHVRRSPDAGLDETSAEMIQFAVRARRAEAPATEPGDVDVAVSGRAAPATRGTPARRVVREP